MNTREILLRAAEILERDGWTQGAYEHDGKCCMVGALILAGQGWSVARNAVRDNIGMEPIYWNDAKDRTASEVIAKLREVAGTL